MSPDAAPEGRASAQAATSPPAGGGGTQFVPPPDATDAGVDSSTPPPPPPSASPNVIGPAGGTVSSASGVQVVIPVGALAAPTDITLVPIAAPDAATLGATPMGPGIAAGPDGTTFLKPVTVRVPFDIGLLPAGADPTRIVLRMAPDGSTAFSTIASTVDVTAGVVIAQTTHFTSFLPALPLPGNPPSITTPTVLPAATVGAAYSTTFAATGGTPPYAWSIAGGSALPAGLALTAGGVLSGTPTTAGNSAFFVVVQDGAASQMQAAFSITASAPVSPVPVLKSMTPNSTWAEGKAFTINVTGTGFAPASQIVFDGTELPTTFVSTTSLSGSLAAALISGTGTKLVRVSTPAPGGGTSSALPFTTNPAIRPPLPLSITAVAPSQIPISAIATQVTITGTGFVAGTSAAIGNQGLVTKITSTTTLVGTIPASYLAADGTLLLDVYSPTNGGFSWTTVPVTVGNPASIPVLTILSPTSASVGAATFTLTASGAGFVNGGTLYFGATALATTVDSPTSAHATVDSSLITSNSTMTVTFVNPSPSGATAPMAFNVGSGTPQVGITCTYTDTFFGSYLGPAQGCSSATPTSTSTTQPGGLTCDQVQGGITFTSSALEICMYGTPVNIPGPGTKTNMCPVGTYSYGQLGDGAYGTATLANDMVTVTFHAQWDGMGRCERRRCDCQGTAPLW